MTPEELAKNELEKLRKSGELTFPIDPFKILHDAGIYFVLKDFENLDGIIIYDEDNCTIVGINSNNGWQRQRFTAAHEYCHFIKDLNKEIGTTDYIECLKKSNKKIEKYANDAPIIATIKVRTPITPKNTPLLSSLSINNSSSLLS